MASDRFRRDDPERTGPIRDVSGLFRQGRGRASLWPFEPWSTDARGGPGAAGADDPSAGSPDWRPWWSAFPEDAAAQGVRTGYRVAAEELDEQATNGSDGDGPSPSGGMPRPEDVQNLTLRMWRYAADLMWLWSDLMSAMARDEAPPTRGGAAPGEERAGADPAHRPGGGDTPAAVTVEIASRTPVRVKLSIDAQVTGPLTVQKLRDLEERLDPIEGAVVTAAPGTATVRLHVPDDQPAGLYSGSVLSRETQVAVGHLTVEVLGPAPAAEPPPP